MQRIKDIPHQLLVTTDKTSGVIKSGYCTCRALGGSAVDKIHRADSMTGKCFPNSTTFCLTIYLLKENQLQIQTAKTMEGKKQTKK